MELSCAYVMRKSLHGNYNSNRPYHLMTNMADSMQDTMQQLEDELQRNLEESLDKQAKSSKKKKGNANAGNSSGSTCVETGDLLRTIVPIITKAVVGAVAGAMNTLADKIANQLKDSFNQQMLLIRYEQDKLEQYSRRETVRISGLKESDAEDYNSLKEEVVKLTNEMGCDIHQSDISICHRNGRDGGSGNKPRQVLVKFVSREKKIDVMKKKKNLKDKTHRKGVYINEDLTAPRAKLFKAIREKKVAHSVYTQEGRIFVRMKANERAAIVESPDDLLKVGFNQDEIREMQSLYIKWNIGEVPNVVTAD